MIYLLTYIKYVTKSLDEGESIDVFYLDFAKTFDKIPHQILLHKLKLVGVVGKVHEWISAWHVNGKQRVVLNGTQSGLKDVKRGVPQGSV